MRDRNEQRGSLPPLKADIRSNLPGTIEPEYLIFPQVKQESDSIADTRTSKSGLLGRRTRSSRRFIRRTLGAWRRDGLCEEDVRANAAALRTALGRTATASRPIPVKTRSLYIPRSEWISRWG